MSQSTALNPRSVGPLSQQNNENLVELLQNLTEFITASANLVQSLKQTIESQLQPEVEIDCTCPGTEQEPQKNIEPLPKRVSISVKDKPVKTEVKNEPKVEEKKEEKEDDEVKEEKRDDEVKEEKKDDEVKEEKKVDSGDTNKDDDTMDENKDVVKEKPKSNVKQESNKDIRKSCECASKDTASKPSIAISKTQVKVICPNSKTMKNKKQKVDKFKKEKLEKMAKLKEDVVITQQNLSDIQEQIRQIERLFEDYDSMNTPDGQVNPAALYKEIMKPQSVPYVSLTKASTPLIQKASTPAPCAPCAPCSRQQLPEVAYQPPAPVPCAPCAPCSRQHLQEIAYHPPTPVPCSPCAPCNIIPVQQKPEVVHKPPAPTPCAPCAPCNIPVQHKPEVAYKPPAPAPCAPCAPCNNVEQQKSDVSFKNIYYRNSQAKISVLSTVPYNQAYY